MIQTPHFDMEYYRDLALRRKWWIIAPLVFSFVIGLVCLQIIPKIFEANTLILVQPQKIPASYVNPTVTESVQNRLHTISQQIYSRTNLEKIIEVFNLTETERENNVEKKSIFDLVESLRRKIKVDIRQRGQRSSVEAFEISFEWHDPKVAADITNALASQFIEENLKVRETMAIGTTHFLDNEATKIKKELEKQEKAVEKFKKKHMGMLPDQLQANINILGQLKEQLNNIELRVRNEQEKILFLRRQIELLQTSQVGDNNIPQLSTPKRLKHLKEQLGELRSRYTEKHPDVIALKHEISTLGGARQERFSGFANELEKLEMELHQANQSIGNYKAEAKKIKEQISLYQERIERTPQVELQLTTLTRDYATVRDRYDSLLNKKIDAQLAEQLERRQKGEQFKVIDPAIVPEKPVKPDGKKIMLMALLMGLGAGCGLAYFREMMDAAFYSAEDLESFLDAKILVSIPSVKGSM